VSAPLPNRRSPRWVIRRSFLSEVGRIARNDYQPTAEDIMRARLRTLGVEEHRIMMETAVESGEEWVIYDVGGCRGMRASWAPYFDDVNFIIFLAPVSAFNQMLAEDDTVNRLMDSLSLWKSICSNRLLARARFILLLNKVDILIAKLKAGVRFNQYVTSFKDRPNDTEHVTKYLTKKFKHIYSEHSPEPRSRWKVYVHITCTLNIRATSIVLGQIREVILVNNMSSAALL